MAKFRAPPLDSTNIVLRAKRTKINPAVPLASIQQNTHALFASSLNEVKITAIAVLPAITSVKQVGILENQAPGDTIRNDSPFTFIKFIRSHPNTDEFVYMVRNSGNTSYNPYDLQVVKYADIPKNSEEGFFTMSANVTVFTKIGCHTL